VSSLARYVVRTVLGYTALVLLVLIAIIIVFSAMAPNTFASLSNARLIAQNASILAILGVGMTFVIITSGIDLSIGMLAGVQSPPTLVAADAQSLPLTDASLDVVMMMHMLYHVPDPARAVAEASRVFRRDGKLLVATNGRRHLAEMNDLWLPLLDRTGLRAPLEDSGLVNQRVYAGDARRLVRLHFQELSMKWLRSSVIVTDAAPVVRHAASTTAAHAVGEHREELIGELSDAITSQIRRDGQFTIMTEVAFLTATNA